MMVTDGGLLRILNKFVKNVTNCIAF